MSLLAYLLIGRWTSMLGRLLCPSQHWEPVENLHADDLIQDYKHHWQGAVWQAIAAIYLWVTKIKEGKQAAQQYQIHTPKQLKQKIDKSTNLSEVKQIAHEAIRHLQTQENNRKPKGSYMAKKRKIIDKWWSYAPTPQVTDNYEPWYVNRDMSLGQFNVQTSAMEQMAQEFQQWHLCDN